MSPWILAAALLLQEPAPGERARDVVDRIAFPSAEEVRTWTDKGPEYAAVLEVLLRKENWILAVQDVERRFAPVDPAWSIEVVLREWAGREAATSDRTGARGQIRFNLRRLGEYERRLIAWRKQADDLRREGKRMRWKVPPVKYERILHHELTHILQGDYRSPGWFHEGLATWASDDLSYVIAFGHARKPVLSIETDLSADPDDEYGRGMMFFRWLESLKGRDGVRKLYAEGVARNVPWKTALEQVSGLPWDKIVETERAWSAAFCRRHTPED